MLRQRCKDRMLHLWAVLPEDDAFPSGRCCDGKLCRLLRLVVGTCATQLGLDERLLRRVVAPTVVIIDARAKPKARVRDDLRK